jgi:hypothetical protein
MFDLSQVKLKRVETKDSSGVLANAIATEKEMNRRMREADVDFWYDAIKELTYETVFVSITPKEAEAMASYYNANVSGAVPSDETNAVLAEVERRVDDAMKPFGGDGVFVKLASRSPKDATNRGEAASEALKKCLEDLNRQLDKENRRPTPDDVVNVVFQAHIASFRLYNAHEVMQTLVHSNRVCTDEIPLVLEHLAEWKEQIVLRRWRDLPVKFEMRGFVFGGRLTGLAQYYNEVVCPEVVRAKEEIAKLCLDCAERAIPRIPITPQEYCIDFIVDLERGEALIVEINPFGEPDGLGTGCILFDPLVKEDADVLFGRKPFEFRIETQPLCKSDYEQMVAGSRRSESNHWARSSLLGQLPDFDFQ